MDTFFPPGPQKSLLMGNARQFKGDALQFMADATRAHGELVHFRFGPAHAYLVTNPNQAHHVLVESADKFRERPSVFSALNSGFGHELFAPDDKKRKPGRRQPLFQQRWLEPMMADIVEDVASVLATWRHGEQCDFMNDLKAVTLRSAARIVFGADDTDAFAALADGLKYAPELSDRGYQSPLSLPRSMAWRGQQPLAQLNQLIKRMIHNRCISADGHESILCKLVNAADARQIDPMSSVQLREELVTLFLALTDTTVNTLAWACTLLAQHPEMGEQLYSEIDTVLGDRLPEVEDLSRLVYAEMVIKETLRLYPPVWMMSRQARGEQGLGKYFVPAGSTIFISPYIIHHSRRYFVDPEAFLPERFAEGCERRLSPYAYMPFGAGVRATVEKSGTMLLSTLLLATIAQRFHLSPESIPQMERGLTLRPAGDFKLCVEERAANLAGTLV
jgi:cytochrome P450